MANNLISQSRQKAQNQMEPNDFFSWGNAKKAGSDFFSAAIPGLATGAAVGGAVNSFNALRTPATVPQLNSIPKINGKFDLSKSGLGGAAGPVPRQLMGSRINLQGNLPMMDNPNKIGFLDQVSGSANNFKAINEFVKKLMPEDNSTLNTSGVAGALQKSGPIASSGPISNQAGTGQQTPYYAFEKFFQGGDQMRALMPDQAQMNKELYPGVNGNPQPQPLTQQPAESKQGIGQQEGPAEDQYRPKSGISQKLYDFSKYVENSPVIQQVAGGLTTLGVGVATGGVGLLAGSAISAAGAGGTKLLSGQLRQWLENREKQEQQKAQQSAVAQPLQ